jgi:glycosyltransferase involved in cell wall biosynthesis
MKIVIASDAWEPQVNGVVRTLQATIAKMRARGIDVHIIHPGQFHSFGLPTYPDIRLALVGAGRMKRILSEMEPDIIHIATEGPIGWAMRSACIATKHRFTTSYHTRFPEYVRARMPIPTRWTYPIFRRFHSAAAKTLVSTKRIADELKTQGFCNIAPWSRGVDLSLFHPRDDGMLNHLPRPIFVTVSRLSVEKNLEAFLSLKLPGSMVVVGDGPQAVELRTRFPKAHFMGLQTGEELARIYAASDVFVFPSLTDTYGIVMLEAAASGLPIAAFPVPGPIDVMGDSHAAVLDHDLQKACIEALHLNRVDCVAFAEQHSWSAATDQFLTAVMEPHNINRLKSTFLANSPTYFVT